eukprot:15176-Pleurochrysis_carterae.AAC.1
MCAARTHARASERAKKRKKKKESSKQALSTGDAKRGTKWKRKVGKQGGTVGLLASHREPALCNPVGVAAGDAAKVRAANTRRTRGAGGGQGVKLARSKTESIRIRLHRDDEIQLIVHMGSSAHSSKPP